MKRNIALIIVGAVIALLTKIAFAQDSKNQGYLVDTYGNNIVASPGTDQCWRSSDWTPARAVASCDPIALQIESIITPAIVATPHIPIPKPPEISTLSPLAIASKTINFSADVLFAFDEFVLKPEEKLALNKVLIQIRGIQNDPIFVTGHTDRFGSVKYNQRLSERRANAVSKYLMSKDISVGRIKTEGRGDKQPVTTPSDCKGTKTVTTIACLQVDRRVNVVVTGTGDAEITMR